MKVPRTAVTGRAASFAVTLLALIIHAGSAHAEERPALTPQAVVARAGAAVVMIEAESDDGTGQGSGFVVEGDGAIVTNLHVLAGASTLTVSLRDGTRFTEVAVRAFDVERDLAVVVVELPNGAGALPTVELGDTTSIEPGAAILVIGNPLGLEQTVTEGIVSAWREPGGEDAGRPEDDPRSALLLPPCRLLQISAAISPGSSGGPVFNDRGEVIGVAASGVLHGIAGLNFAVPVDELPALLDEDMAMDLMTFQERVDGERLELARPHLESAEVAYDREESRAAADHLERALQLHPRYEEALLLAGRIALESGQIDLAEKRLGEAARVSEDNAEAWFLLGKLHHEMAIARDDAALLFQAEAEYEKTLELEARHGGAAYNLAVILAGRGSFDRAEELLRVAIDSGPEITDAYYTLGEIYLAQGRFGEATTTFEQALWEDQDHALSHFGLAKLYTMIDRTPQGTRPPHGPASEHWERFLELTEGDPALATERQIALRIVQEYFPHLLDR
jgi:S1-C subfamily serine protease